MPYPQPFLRHTLLWTLPGGEVASTSCAWDNDGGGIVGTPTDIGDALAVQGTALWNSIKDQYSNNVKYVGSRVAWIGVTGATIETLDYSAAPIDGFGSEPNLPTEVAVCVSLRTGTNSRRGRGRMYLPCTKQSSLAADGRLGTSSTSDIADGMEDYLLVPIVIDTVTYFPVVASKADMALRPVTSLRVGNVFDAQRRRRDALSEVYEVRTP